MDIELYKKIKKHNFACIEELSKSSLKRIWFICWYTTLDSSTAVPLLLNCWMKTLNKIAKGKSPPSEDFAALFSVELLNDSVKDIVSDDTFSKIKQPAVSKKYQALSDPIAKIDHEMRIIWIVNRFGNLNAAGIANATGISKELAKEFINKASDKYTNEVKKSNNISGVKLVALLTEFTCSDGKGVEAIEIPQIIYKSILRKYIESAPTNGRKEKIRMHAERTQKRRNAKIKKTIITISIIAIILTVLIIFIPKMLKAIKGDDVAATAITTYKAEEITYGDVDTTISGSGSLSPIRSETISAPYPECYEEKTDETVDISDNGQMSSNTIEQKENFKITELNISAGDEFTEGDVLAVLKNEDDETTKIKAEYNGIVLEVDVQEKDEITSGDEIAMLMSKDGFELNISVDELEISDVEQGQEVTVNVDAVSEEYTGTVSAVSYNGSNDSSSVSYDITIQIDYAEGIYPAMSASAEIVIESSGEGLLIPVEAVQTSGDNSYVYLAPNGSESGTEYDEDEIILSDLDTVTIETGMSDGSYILIESEELSEGDLIIVTKVTSTLSGSDSANETGGFGGMPGNLDFGNIDFENFDPNNMPQGGGMPDFGGMQ